MITSYRIVIFAEVVWYIYYLLSILCITKQCTSIYICIYSSSVMYTSREWKGNITNGGETLAFGKQYLGGILVVRSAQGASTEYANSCYLVRRLQRATFTN